MDVQAFKALPAGVYLATEAGNERAPRPVMINRDGVFSMAGRMTDRWIEGLSYVQPLERQGGLSGAMYWGEVIR